MDIRTKDLTASVLWMLEILQRPQVKTNRMVHYSASNNHHRTWLIKLQTRDIPAQAWEEITSKGLTAAPTLLEWTKTISSSSLVEAETQISKVETQTKTMQEALAEVIRDHKTRIEDIKTSSRSKSCKRLKVPSLINMQLRWCQMDHLLLMVLK